MVKTKEIKDFIDNIDNNIDIVNKFYVKIHRWAQNQVKELANQLNENISSKKHMRNIIIKLDYINKNQPNIHIELFGKCLNNRFLEADEKGIGATRTSWNYEIIISNQKLKINSDNFEKLNKKNMDLIVETNKIDLKCLELFEQDYAAETDVNYHSLFWRGGQLMSKRETEELLNKADVEERPKCEFNFSNIDVFEKNAKNLFKTKRVLLTEKTIDIKKLYEVKSMARDCGSKCCEEESPDTSPVGERG